MPTQSTARFYELHLTTVGCSSFVKGAATKPAQERMDYGMGARRWDGHNWGARQTEMPENSYAGRWTVAIIDNTLYVSSEIINALDLDRSSQRYAKQGRRRYDHITEDALLRALIRCDYPSRNDNELGVSARDAQIIDWLGSLV